MNKSIYLSPSLQDQNVGVGGYGTEQKRMNELADIVQPHLEAYGFTVYRSNPSWTLKQAVDDSNSKKTDIHVALHSNADNGKARGCEIFSYKFEGPSYELAKDVYEQLSAITPATDRGIKQGYNFYGEGKSMYELEKVKVPAILCEISFHDNLEDAYWIINNMDSISLAIVNGILKYFDMPLDTLTEDLKYAVHILESYNIINTPEYWLLNAIKGKTVDGEYAAQLINNMAKYLSKLANNTNKNTSNL